MRRHPDQDAVLRAIEEFMTKRVFRGWSVHGLHYDFRSSTYELVCTNGTVTVSVKLLSEWIDKALDSHESFARRPIKHALKDAFKIEDAEFDSEG